jgi:hypothetical protein
MSNAQAQFHPTIYGTVVANNAVAVAVPLPAVTATSTVILSLNNGGAAGANAGQARVTSVTAGTGFSITGGVADKSTYRYLVL